MITLLIKGNLITEGFFRHLNLKIKSGWWMCIVLIFGILEEEFRPKKLHSIEICSEVFKNLVPTAAHLISISTL